MLQTTCQPCVSECGRCLALGDGPDRCLTCLGSKHAEVVFVDESSSHCGCSSRSCGQAPLPRQRGGALLPPSRSSSRPGCRQARSTSGGRTGGLRITVVANPQGPIAPLALRNQLERAGPSTWSVSAVSLALLLTTRCCLLHRRVSRSFWRGRFGCAAAPAVAMPESDLEMTAMLSQAAERVGLE